MIESSTRRSAVWLIGGGAIACCAALLIGVLVGGARLGVVGVLHDLTTQLPLVRARSPLSATDHAILWEIRLPRVVLGLLVGSMLAISGAAYQSVFHNPLADPYLLGVAAGAGLGVTVAVAFRSAAGGLIGDVNLLPIAAFVGATAAVVFTLFIARAAGRGRGPATLLLAGIIVGTFLSAVQAFVLQAHTDTLLEVYSWLLGRLRTSGWAQVTAIAPYVAVSCAVMVVHARQLDVMRLGDDEAQSLGVAVARTRLIIIIAATVGTAAAVSVSGLIGFVGLVIPNAIRLAAGASYRIVLPLSMLLGGAFLVLADALARSVLAPSELPIGVITALIGAPCFALLLWRANTGGVSS